MELKKIIAKDSTRTDIGRAADVYIALDFDLQMKPNLEGLKATIANITDQQERQYIEKLFYER